VNEPVNTIVKRHVGPEGSTIQTDITYQVVPCFVVIQQIPGTPDRIIEVFDTPEFAESFVVNTLTGEHVEPAKPKSRKKAK
jgi:hypothetical protein